MPGSERSASPVSGNTPPCSSTIFRAAAAQVPRPRVVAQARPEAQHVVEARLAQRAHVGEAGHEALVEGDDGLHLGLLEHDLAHPDGVGIARAAPGEIAGLPRVPGEQRFVKAYRSARAAREWTGMVSAMGRPPGKGRREGARLSLRPRGGRKCKGRAG